MCVFSLFQEDFMNFLRFSTAAALVLGLASPLLGMKLDQNEQLFNAIEGNNLQRVNQILTSPDVNLNASNADGSTPLILAIHKNNLEIVRKLLRSGADPFKEGKFTAEQEQANSPLVHAAMFAGDDFEGNAKMIEAIVETQNQIDSQTSLSFIKNAMDLIRDYNTNYIQTLNKSYANNVASGLQKNYTLLKKLSEK
jgi:ankyrin repeat protein